MAARVRNRLSVETCSEAILRIHELATADRDRWNDNIRKIGQLLGSEKALLFFPTRTATDLPGAVVGLDPDTLADYALHWHQYDVWTNGGNVQGLFDQSRVILGEAIVSHKEFLRSTVYNECLRNEGVGRLMAGVIRTSRSCSSVPMAVCSFYQAAEDGPFSRQSQEIYRLLLPHFIQSMETFFRLRDTGASALLAGTVLEQIGATFFVLDNARRVVYASSAAEEKLPRKVLTVRRGRVSAAGDRQDAAMLDYVLQTAKRGKSATARLKSPAGTAQTQITAVPIPPATLDQLTYLRPSVLLLLENVGSFDSRLEVDWICARYELTRGEARVLEKIIEGRSRRQAAEELGISTNTVHTHVKRILEKTETTSQRELLALILSRGQSNVPRRQRK